MALSEQFPLALSLRPGGHRSTEKAKGLAFGQPFRLQKGAT
jgi:hypothetical protein